MAAAKSATLSKFTSLDSGIDRWEELDLSGMELAELQTRAIDRRNGKGWCLGNQDLP